MRLRRVCFGFLVEYSERSRYVYSSTGHEAGKRVRPPRRTSPSSSPFLVPSSPLFLHLHGFCFAMKFLALAAFVAVACQPAHALWPQPTSVETGSTTLKLSPVFTIAVSGLGVPNDVWDAVFRTEAALNKDKLGRLVVGRGASDASSFSKAKTLSKLTLSLEKGAKWTSITSEAQKAPEDRDEAYHLTIPSDGAAATLTANSTLGLYRGLTTFGQFWYEHSGTTYTVDAPVKIQDAPAYVCCPGLSDFPSSYASTAVPRIHARHRA